MKLADRIEQAKEPSRELDFLIWIARNAPDARLYYSGGGEMYVRRSPPTTAGKILTHEGYENAPPCFTASLDAAMTLVPEGLEWELFGYDPKRDPRFGRFQARIMLMRYEDDPEELGPQAISNGHTPALALCAAAIRAQEAGE